MIARAALAMAARTPPRAHTPPADCATRRAMPLIERPPPLPGVSDHARDEVNAGRCPAAGHGGDGHVPRVDRADLVAANGPVHRILRRAIPCPMVAQYAAGLASRIARANVFAPGADRWFRNAMTFTWAV